MGVLIGGTNLPPSRVLRPVTTAATRGRRLVHAWLRSNMTVEFNSPLLPHNCAERTMCLPRAWWRVHTEIFPREWLHVKEASARICHVMENGVLLWAFAAGGQRRRLTSKWLYCQTAIRAPILQLSMKCIICLIIYAYVYCLSSSLPQSSCFMVHHINTRKSFNARGSREGRVKKLHASDEFKDRVLVLETNFKLGQKRVDDLSAQINSVSKEMREGNKRLAKETKDLAKEIWEEMKEGNGKLAKEMKEGNGKLAKETKDLARRLERRWKREMKSLQRRWKRESKSLQRRQKILQRRLERRWKRETKSLQRRWKMELKSLQRR